MKVYSPPHYSLITTIFCKKKYDHQTRCLN